MKQVKYLLLLLVALLVIPFAVYADEEEEVVEDEAVVVTEQSKEVNVYLFRGEGCPHCQEFEEWIDSIEGEYGDLFVLHSYETWYDQDNAELMKKVAEARHEEAGGVPYIIVEDKSWSGFTSDWAEEILQAIKSEYAKDVDKRYDVASLVDGLGVEVEKVEKKQNDVLSLLVILAVAGIVCFGVYHARKSNQ